MVTVAAAENLTLFAALSAAAHPHSLLIPGQHALRHACHAQMNHTTGQRPVFVHCMRVCVPTRGCAVWLFSRRRCRHRSSRDHVLSLSVCVCARVAGCPCRLWLGAHTRATCVCMVWYRMVCDVRAAVVCVRLLYSLYTPYLCTFYDRRRNNYQSEPCTPVWSLY